MIGAGTNNPEKYMDREREQAASLIRRDPGHATGECTRGEHVKCAQAIHMHFGEGATKDRACVEDQNEVECEQLCFCQV
jgi:hypothetical protein